MGNIEVSARRRARQSGNEFMEFALVMVLFTPLCLFTFITGFNVIRSIQANHIVRDLSDMFIHGADFSTYPMQQMAQRLATGMDLRIGSSFTGSNASNTSNQGRGLITVTQVMWVGSQTDPKCASLQSNQTCTNHDSFVFTQRVQFGNGALNSQHPSNFGNPSVPLSSTGTVNPLDTLTQTGAKLPSGPQAEMVARWQSGAGPTTPLADGQVIYSVEGYFRSPDINMFEMFEQTEGVYARWFF